MYGSLCRPTTAYTGRYVCFNLFSINPLTALLWAAVINGMVAVPMMVLLMMMATNPRIMGEFVISTVWIWLGWLATAVMCAATIAFILATAQGG
jgi:Mn2+/Fe2+ NRAMP family transporter